MTKRIVLSALAVLGVAGTAAAAPLVLPSNAPVYFQFNDMEQSSATASLTVPGYAPAAGLLQSNWALFNVSTMQNGAVTVPHVDISGGTPFFVDGGPGGHQITGILYGVQPLPAAECAASGFAQCGTGGIIDLFWEDSGSVSTACLSGGPTCPPDAATVGLFTSGTFLARLDLASGVSSTDPKITVESNTITTTPGASGQADSFLEVDNSKVGAWTSALDGNWFNTAFGTRDVRLSNFFNVTLTSWDDPTVGALGLRSNDPGRVFTAVTVPEPATLTLLGLGLASIGYRRRKRN